MTTANGGQGLSSPGTSMYVPSMLGFIVQASSVVSRLAFVLRVPNVSYPFNSTDQFECADKILEFERAFPRCFRSKKGWLV